MRISPKILGLELLGRPIEIVGQAKQDKHQ